MFPDVRLLIGAIIASVIMLVCGFGVFAAFRVNHEPLARLSNVSAPVSLVADSAALRVAPFPGGETRGSRFEISDGTITGSIAGAAAAPPHADVPNGTLPDSVAAQRPQVVVSAPPLESAAPPSPPAADAASASLATIVQPPAAASGSSLATMAQPSVAAPELQQPAAPASDSAAPASGLAESNQAEAAPTHSDQASSQQSTAESSAPAVPGAPATPAVAQGQEHIVTQASQMSGPEPKAAAGGAPVAVSPANGSSNNGVKAAAREHAATAIVRRVRRPRVAAVTPPNNYDLTFAQPNFQPAPPARSGAQPAQQSNTLFFGADAAAVPRQVIRHRLVRRPAPQQSGLGGPFVSPPARGAAVSPPTPSALNQ